MKTIVQQIKETIEQSLEIEGDYIIYPFGDVGIQIKNILKDAYDIVPAYIIDEHLCLFNKKIYNVNFLSTIDCSKYKIVLASTNKDIYEELWLVLKRYFSEDRIFEIECMKNIHTKEIKAPYHTIIEKYSYGSICKDHEYIAKIGAFCSFAEGVDAVPNHEMKYITTHPMLYHGQQYEGYSYKYENFKNCKWYFEGVHPKDCVTKRHRSIIGNDVWLGRNVTITNGVNIGNGVIAGAGAIITKDIPDYAVVVGSPARIIRYRYSNEQIKALNRIQWWNWTDDKIRANYDDFYLPIDQFIAKHDVKEVCGEWL